MNTEQEAVKFPVFADHRGNRFVFPGLYSYESQRADWEYCLRIQAALNVSQEKATFDVIPDAEGMLVFPRVIASAGSSGFRHGSSDVWLIGGPKFDEVYAADQSNANREAGE